MRLSSSVRHKLHKMGSNAGCKVVAQLKQMPDYSNPATRETELRLGSFVLDNA